MTIYPICSETIFCGTPTPVVNYPFYINLYRNKAENNKLDKTGYLQLQYRVKGTLRNSCSLIKPIIILEVDPLLIDSICVECNYCYIEEFNRYYFITDIVSTNKSMWELYLEVDILMSYKQQIGNTNSLILRNQFKYNSYIEDKNIFLEYKEKIKEYEPDNIRYININPTNTFDHHYIGSNGRLAVTSNLDNRKHIVYEYIFNEGTISRIKINSTSDNNSGNNCCLWSFEDRENVLLTSSIKGSGISTLKDEVVIVPRNATKLLVSYISNSGYIYNVGIDDTISFNPALNDDFNVICYLISKEANNLTSPNSNNSISFLPNVNFKTTDKMGVAFPYLFNYKKYQDLCEKIKVDDVSKSYVISSVVYPFIIPHRVDNLGKPIERNIYLGDKQILDIQARLPVTRQSPYILNRQFMIKGETNSFLDYSPYTKYELYIPYVGWIELDSSLILNKNLYLYYIINYEDSTSYYILCSDTNIIQTGSANLGDDISISSSNKLEIDRAKQANTANMLLNAISGGISGGIGASISGAMHNPIGVGLGIASGVSGVASSITKGIMNERQLFVKGQSTITSGSYGLYSPQNVRVRITRLIPVNYNEEYNRLYGRPLNETHLIKEMRGYTVMGDFHLENFDTATKQEIDMITEELSKGIII